MTREEFRAMVREEVQSILKEEFRNILNRELRVPEHHPIEGGHVYEPGDDHYRSYRDELNDGLHYCQSLEASFNELHKEIQDRSTHLFQRIHRTQQNLENVANAIWPGHGPQHTRNITRPDKVLELVNEKKNECLGDPNYKDIRLSNIEKAVEHFKDDVEGLVYWLHYWSMCPYPERPWSGEPYVDLGEETPDINRTVWDRWGLE